MVKKVLIKTALNVELNVMSSFSNREINLNTKNCVWSVEIIGLAVHNSDLAVT